MTIPNPLPFLLLLLLLLLGGWHHTSSHGISIAYSSYSYHYFSWW